MVCGNRCGVLQEVGRLSLVHVSPQRYFELPLASVAAVSDVRTVWEDILAECNNLGLGWMVCGIRCVSQEVRSVVCCCLGICTGRLSLVRKLEMRPLPYC